MDQFQIRWHGVSCSKEQCWQRKLINFASRGFACYLHGFSALVCCQRCWRLRGNMANARSSSNSSWQVNGILCWEFVGLSGLVSRRGLYPIKLTLVIESAVPCLVPRSTTTFRNDCYYTFSLPCLVILSPRKILRPLPSPVYSLINILLVVCSALQALDLPREAQSL